MCWLSEWFKFCCVPLASVLSCDVSFYLHASLFLYFLLVSRLHLLAYH